MGATTLVIWAVTLGLFLTHQLEETVYPIAGWHDTHPKPGWPRWTSYLARTPMASHDPRIRVPTVARQTVMLALVAVVSIRGAGADRRSPRVS